MDLVTGAGVTVAMTVPMSRERVWERVTAVERIGEWSPETVGASWCAPATAAVPGGRFRGHNVFPGGFASTVTCEVVALQKPEVFAWTVLDQDGRAGSVWRYELGDGDEPGTTVVRHTFTHGPGDTGVRAEAATDPGTLHSRLTTLCGNMVGTIAAMTSADVSAGGAR
ncbi:SRPBCC family protein [Actinoplanes sp. NPDC051851]|uniref:SRPBCC family protein n=1 Tax=Actinoplanes sp. NPDC051851 TaxID=3154753 RepID=UPI00342C576C